MNNKAIVEFSMIINNVNDLNALREKGIHEKV